MEDSVLIRYRYPILATGLSLAFGARYGVCFTVGLFGYLKTREALGFTR